MGSVWGRERGTGAMVQGSSWDSPGGVPEAKRQLGRGTQGHRDPIPGAGGCCWGSRIRANDALTPKSKARASKGNQMNALG